jgi:hypothetical protein
MRREEAGGTFMGGEIIKEGTGVNQREGRAKMDEFKL